MDASLGRFRAALLLGWLVLGAAGLLYAREKGIPGSTAAPVVAAFLVEYLFYLAAGFPAARIRLACWDTPRLAAAVTVSIVLPYLVYSLLSGVFGVLPFAQLAALSVVVSFWFLALPQGRSRDVLYLILLAAVILSGLLDRIYTSPLPGIKLDLLGHLSLVHAAVICFLLVRRAEDPGYSFVPARNEWIGGIRNFLYFLPLGLPLALAIGLVQPRLPNLWPVRVVLTFVSVLWTVALSEEFFFRGLLQRWIAKWSGSVPVALVVTSILFGLCHLGPRQFPNWKLALVASIAGIFYGRAYLQTQSIRASMVTHALMVTVWKVFFI